ncbi:hypothetical protein [Corynebacterium halotolerans]|uniref:Uncharacterized protein n=1 Tax=Corynebacterium halotolerans YIM 70093 = DSM 44683 TaxID=1121362 RepID=M1P643_9CORY|nr:hypothetical protein [Corynebacterium halotolerans]AGF72116.1 hypothetical protein A605_05550 [Corynebacterium halotolerans YIM 70093 = DSM 44683]
MGPESLAVRNHIHPPDPVVAGVDEGNDVAAVAAVAECRGAAAPVWTLTWLRYPASPVTVTARTTPPRPA